MTKESYPEAHRRLIIPTTIPPSEHEVIQQAIGVWVKTERDDQWLLDACSQVSCANLGHNHPKLTRWMGDFWRAAEKGDVTTVVMATDFFYRNQLEIDGEKMELSPVSVAERLAPHIFGKDRTIFGFHTSGTQAINMAIRYFRTITQKPHWISFEKSFHGRDGEARDSSDSNPVHWNEAPRNPYVHFLPYPETEEDLHSCLNQLNSIPLSECSCVIYEPVQGEGGGMRVGKYLKPLEDVLRNEGIFIISDEVQAGLGRSGAWFGYQRLGLIPDAVVLGKTLGSGHPVSAVGFRKEVIDLSKFPQGKVSGTFPMSPVGIAAANFTLKIYEEEHLVENARKLSPHFDRVLKQAIQAGNDQEYVYKIDGLGLYRSIKPLSPDYTPDSKKRDEILVKLRELGIWTLGASKSFPAIRLTPALVSTRSELAFIGRAISSAINFSDKTFNLPRYYPTA